MIITLCGGGSTFTPGIVKSIALRKDELDVDEIRLYDINEERQRKIGVLVDWILHEDLGLDIKLTVTTDKKTAFTDASFVFAQMRVGGYAMREQDEKIPLRHGCVGQETCGCGGMAYGMRTIFPMIKLIDDVEKYAKKDYWILNYSNPAAILADMERFLLEMGDGFCFVARQKRLTIGADDFYIDLLFYHRKLRRLVAVELKVGDFKAAYKGQMELYLRWLDKHEREPEEASPLGIILCTGKKREQIELLELDKSGIHVAEYLTALPPRGVLVERLQQATQRAQLQIEQRKTDAE